MLVQSNVALMNIDLHYWILHVPFIKYLFQIKHILFELFSCRNFYKTLSQHMLKQETHEPHGSPERPFKSINTLHKAMIIPQLTLIKRGKGQIHVHVSSLRRIKLPLFVQN